MRSVRDPGLSRQKLFRKLILKFATGLRECSPRMPNVKIVLRYLFGTPNNGFFCQALRSATQQQGFDVSASSHVRGFTAGRAAVLEYTRRKSVPMTGETRRRKISCWSGRERPLKSDIS